MSDPGHSRTVVPAHAAVPIPAPAQRQLPNKDGNGQFISKIGVVCFGSIVQKRVLARMIEKMNAANDCFSYELVEGEIDPEGDYDGTHYYTNDWYFRHLDVRRSQKKHADFLIGVTHDELEAGRFNAHAEAIGLGIVTIHGEKTYRPASMQIDQYLAFLVLCESFCLIGARHYEHPNKLYDLFDECRDKSDFSLCLTDPKIHRDSRQKLTKDGFPTDAGEKILSYIRRGSIRQVFRDFVSNPYVALLGGAAAGQVNIFFPTWLQQPLVGLLFVAIAAWLGINMWQGLGPKKAS